MYVIFYMNLLDYWRNKGSDCLVLIVMLLGNVRWRWFTEGSDTQKNARSNNAIISKLFGRHAF